MNIQPLEQFELKTLIPIRIGSIDISLTNSSVSMILATVLVLSLMFVMTRRLKIIPHPAQSIVEVFYSFIAKMVYETIGMKAEKIIPFIFTLFLFILFGNLLGLFPYTFTFTTHLSVVGAMALLGLTLSTVIGIYHQGWEWLRVFFPIGVPVLLAPIIIPIEIISFLSKPFSLTVRLVMNMVVGHIMLDVIAAFVVVLGLVGFVPLFFVGILIIFEAGIALLQAYIYTILTCIYLSESFEKQH